MGFQKDVKELIREYGLVVVYVVVGDVFCVYVVSFTCGFFCGVLISALCYGWCQMGGCVQ